MDDSDEEEGKSKDKWKKESIVPEAQKSLGSVDFFKKFKLSGSFEK